MADNIVDRFAKKAQKKNAYDEEDYPLNLPENDPARIAYDIYTNLVNGNIEDSKNKLKNNIGTLLDTVNIMALEEAMKIISDSYTGYWGS